MANACIKCKAPVTGFHYICDACFWNYQHKTNAPTPLSASLSVNNLGFPQTQDPLDELTEPLGLDLWKPWDDSHVEKKCTCGADKTYGQGNRLHIDWCDKYEK